MMNFWRIGVPVAFLCLLAFVVPAGETGMHDYTVKLEGTAWWVEDISGRGVIDNSHTTIEFTDDGRVIGDTGCNRYFGSYEAVAGLIHFGPLAGTRKACHAALMDQERAFFEAMTKISSWRIMETGLLHLSDKEGNDMIRAAATVPTQ
jgi:heat shock protein HslJ